MSSGSAVECDLFEMALTVLNVAYPLAPVRADTAGGAEQLLAVLDAALSRAGQHSLVIACEGSQVQGTLVPTPRAQGILDERTRREAHEHHRRVIQLALRRWRVDLV